MTRSIIDMDTVQVELNDACRNSCSNCTRFCGHRQPYYMDFDYFKTAVDSMIGYPKMVGFQGGEPLLHPDFERMCEYARSKFDKSHLGLWTTLPEGFEKYREVICETFYHIFINDHTRNDIYHHPGLVAIEEVITDKRNMWHCIDHCWAQMSWSASINPKGAFFCEIAASMSILFEEDGGWAVEPGWWNRIPKDFTSQMEQYCPRCGFAAPLSRRSSIEGIDDISPKNFDRLKNKSLKIARGAYKISDLKKEPNLQPLAAYKDFSYRNKIAERYGMFLFINEYNTWTPCLKKEFDIDAPKKSLIEIYRERFA
jgi:hypothetical protein